MKTGNHRENLSKRFVILTTGRSGSTALIDSLALHDDIAVPNKQIDCPDNELLNPASIQQIIKAYRQLSGRAITDEMALIEAFYQTNEGVRFIGFKSMPNRHRQLAQLISQDNMQVITLVRRDLASTIASFIIAIDAGTWRREGGEQPHRFVFGPSYEKRAVGHLTYILSSVSRLRAIPNAIHLSFEDLCDPAYCNQALNDYFERSIGLVNPSPPLSGSRYVENWDEFQRFIVFNTRRLQTGAN